MYSFGATVVALWRGLSKKLNLPYLYWHTMYRKELLSELIMPESGNAISNKVAKNEGGRPFEGTRLVVSTKRQIDG